MKVLVLGGDGFCGWPCAVNLADQGHDVLIVDNLSRRKIDIDLEVESLTPIVSIGERLKAWEETGGKPMRFVHMDIASSQSRNRSSMMMLVTGGLLVAAMVAVTVAIS